MAEYIERQAAIDAMTQSVCGDTWEVEKAMEAVRQLPAADVVPVVRCDDCVYYGSRRWCELNSSVFDDNAFCSYGEGKE